MASLGHSELKRLRLEQNGYCFGDDILWGFLLKNLLKNCGISLKFEPKGPIHNNIE